MSKLSILISLAFVILVLALVIEMVHPKIDTDLQVTSQNFRIVVERIGVFGDSLAYGNCRGIYVIHDNQTGAEYIGISGIGISERAAHPTGKTVRADER